MMEFMKKHSDIPASDLEFLIKPFSDVKDSLKECFARGSPKQDPHLAEAALCTVY